MTYKELLAKIAIMTPEQIKHDVLYYHSYFDKHYKVLDIRSGEGDYDEDPNQFFLDIEQ